MRKSIALAALVVALGACSSSPSHQASTAPTTAVPPTTAEPTTTAELGEPQSGAVPNVVGKDLQLAQDTLQAAGFYNLDSRDATGQGRMQIIDRNWKVCKQSVRPGSTPASGELIVLDAVKLDESCP
jgi:hypothetical protein